MASHLLEFYGEECPHCKRNREMLEKLEKEHKFKTERIEVWHNKENVKRMEEYDKGYCGGVPFLFNTKTDKWICGETEEKELKKWALGDKK